MFSYKYSGLSSISCWVSAHRAGLDQSCQSRETQKPKKYGAKGYGGALPHYTLSDRSRKMETPVIYYDRAEYIETVSTLFYQTLARLSSDSFPRN